jgi:uncharacterized tellurite resistance protein B-like protein
VAILLLLLSCAGLVFIAGGALAVTVLRAVRAAAAIESCACSLERASARPGEDVIARAKVVARRGHELSVSATLVCTLFDHRARRLYARSATVVETEAKLTLPTGALRSGTVGDELTALFSEHARRLLVYWSVTFEVRERGRLLRRTSLPLQVPEGRALAADPTFMSQLVVDTFAALRDDLLLNWLVKLAAHDGEIAPSERELLREVLAKTGVTDPAAADARIAAELGREVDIDPGLLRQHVPADARLAFYKLLFAVAWRDGTMDKREHAFLASKLRDFGLTRAEVADVEREVLRGMAQQNLA